MRALTDADLRADLDAGLSQTQIAAKYGVSKQAVSKRARNLSVSTTAAVVAPEESRRFASTNIDAMGELSNSLRRVNMLLDATDEWLRDPDRPDCYTLDARADEVTVIYKEAVGVKPDGSALFEKRRASLQSLLDRAGRETDGGIVSTERKGADPRSLLLQTAAEVRQTVNTLADLGQLLINLQSMERYREKFLSILETVSPEIRDALVEAVRRDLLLSPAFSGTGAVSLSGEG